MSSSWNKLKRERCVLLIAHQSFRLKRFYRDQLFIRNKLDYIKLYWSPIWEITQCLICFICPMGANWTLTIKDRGPWVEPESVFRKMSCCLNSILNKLTLYSYSTFSPLPYFKNNSSPNILALPLEYKIIQKKNGVLAFSLCIIKLKLANCVHPFWLFIVAYCSLVIVSWIENSAMSRWALPHHFPRAVGGRVYFPLSAVYVNGKKEDGIASRPLIASRRVSAARRPGLKWTWWAPPSQLISCLQHKVRAMAF